MEIIKELITNNINYCSLEYILENLEKINFNSISIYPPIYEFKGNEKHVIKCITNEEHPIGIYNNTLYINTEYYKKNKDDIDLMLAKIIFKMKDSISLDGDSLITNYILNVIYFNDKIKELELLNSVGNNYTLKKELYDLFKDNKHIKKIKTKAVEKDLEDVFEPLIDYNMQKKLFDYKTYEELKKTDQIFIEHSTFENNDSKYLSLLKDDCIINIDANDNERLKQNILEVLRNTKCKNLTITVVDKIYFNNNIVLELKKYETENINIIVGRGRYSLNQYMEYEKRLNDLVEPALNLSPLERYLYAYNVVKIFKPYKEVEDKNLKSAFQSRDVYNILDNEYMVCAGYANLLVDLLSRLGISSQKISIKDYTDFDSLIFEYDNDIVDSIDHNYQMGYHARVEVKIVDPKYGVNGIYVADPTWNNSYDFDDYTFALMTKTEHNGMNRENALIRSKIDDTLMTLLEANNIEEFYKFVNYYLNEMKENDIKEERSFDYTFDYNYIFAMENISKSPFDVQKITDIIVQKIKANYLGDIYKDDYFIKKVISNIAMYSFDKIENEEELIKHIDEKLLIVYKEYIKYDYKKEEKEIINYLLKYIKIFNSGLYEEIINKYPIVIQNADKLNAEQFADIIEQVGSYIVSINNNIIKGSTILEAVKEVYKANGLSSSEIEMKIEKTRKANEKASEIYMPRRKKIYADGTEQVYTNPDNKFLEDSVKKR